MKNINGLICGLLLVIVGIILGGNAIGIFNVNVFFEGWWTLFIIIPCFIGLIKDNNKTGSIIGLFIGIVLLLGCQDVIDFDIIGKLIVPIIIVIIGLSLIFKNLFNKKINESIKEINSKHSKNGEYASTFSSQNINLEKEVFEGTELNAVFGGIKLDLRDSIIKEDVVINASAIFGGIDILIPDNVSVKVKSNSIFGGVDNKRKNTSDDKKKYTIYVNATCLFGGVDIK